MSFFIAIYTIIIKVIKLNTWIEKMQNYITVDGSTFIYTHPSATTLSTFLSPVSPTPFSPSAPSFIKGVKGGWCDAANM